MRNMKKVLVIAAHPDDEVYGMGGTIAKFAAKGNEIHVLIITDGCTAQYRDYPNLSTILDKKKQEAKEANLLLGVKEVHFGELPDMRLDTVAHIEVNAIVEKVVENVQPDAVYTHFWGDVNLDHQCVYKSTLVAVRPMPQQSVRELYCYKVPSSTEWSPQTSNTTFMPNVYVDIENYSSIKYKAIGIYKTEMREYPHPRSVQYVEKLDVVAGLKCGLRAAEEFMLLRKIQS